MRTSHPDTPDTHPCNRVNSLLLFVLRSYVRLAYMRSRITLSALLVCLLYFLLSGTAFAQLQGHFSLEKDQFIVGEPVYLRFDLTNQGKEPVQFLQGSRYFFCGGYGIEVSNAPPLQHSSCDYGTGGSCIAGMQIVAPGETRHETLLLNFEHDLSKPGDYDVHAVWAANYGPKTEGFPIPAGGQQIKVEEHLRVRLLDANGENLEPLFQPYIAGLAAQDEEQRIEAARVIGSLAPPFLEDTMVSMLDIPAARSFALRGLKKLNTAHSREVLAGIVQSTTSYSYEKEQIIKYLADMGDKRYFPLLLDIAQKQPPNQARDYVLAAARLGGEDAMPFMKSLLGDSDPFSSGNGLMGLSETGSRSAIPILIELLNSQNSDVGTLALTGLRQLTHRSPFLDGQIYQEFPSRLYPSWMRWWMLNGNSAAVYGPQQCGEILPLT
jgi:hypothetical protein